MTGIKALAVLAHPDDESFGVGGIIAWLRRHSVAVEALVFTQGEESTLGATGDPAALARQRTGELERASRKLGLCDYRLLEYPDGGLADVPLVEEAGPVDFYLAFDWGGITGHNDNVAATEAAFEAAKSSGAGLYLWAQSEKAASGLNQRFRHSRFQGRPEVEVTFRLGVSRDRQAQWEAILCHESQSGGLGVVRARLELLGHIERLMEQKPARRRELFMRGGPEG